MLVHMETNDADQTGKPLDDVIGAYRRLGVVALREFFSAPRVAELADESDRLLEKFRAGEIDPARIAYRPAMGGGQLFERFDPVCDIAPVCARAASDPRLLDLAGRLLQEEPVLFKDKLIYKFDGDRGYALHQDLPYYDVPESLWDGLATFAVAIDGVSQADGGIQFYLGCHGFVQPAPPGQPKDVDPAAVASADKWDAAVPPGSLIVFHTLTPHGSGPNRSGRPRRLLYLTYIRKSSSHMREAYYRRRIIEQSGRTP